MSGHGKWVWSTNEEQWGEGSDHDSPEAAEAEARKCVEPGQAFWVGRKVDPIERVRVDAGDVLEQVGDDAYERVGDVVDGWPGTLGEAVDALSEELTKLVVTYLREHDAPSFFGVEDVEEHVAGEGVARG